MPTSESFSFWYELTGSGSSFTVFRRNAVPTTLRDTQDGNADGTTLVGQLLHWDLGLVIYRGVSAAGAAQGDPIVSQGMARFLLSNEDLSVNTPITLTTVGANPYNYCFAPGTGIATPLGEVAVERLAIGDPILTANGRVVPVRWIGRQTVSKLFAGDRARPVLIRAGALGDGLPQADLTVTADHGMILDGLVINAGALVNGSNITLVPLADLPAAVTYYHVETEDHDVILAHGAPTETFISYVGRAAFDNHADYLALYGADRGMAELPLPRITCTRQLSAALRARLGLTSAA